MLEVLYEDNHLIAINKKSGDIVQGDKTGDAPLSDFVKAYIKKKYNKPGEVFLGTIHRLDRPTSGVILYARTSKALSRMNEQFREKQVQKTYWAVVDNSPPNTSGTLENYLQKNQKQNKSYITKNEGGKHAILDYKLLKKLDNFFHLEIQPKTGRHHQIRVQLAHIGSIIKGDLKYGAKRSNKDASIHLLAQKLEFIHPVTKENITIVAPAPRESIWDACK
ncbi:MAG: RluA family pseudouridine synthase [Flavobacteriales bacterium]|jgi:23S rRNA pseudouridine1911/1915/1917 synthase|nr:RluA family pseudouridine synthase [Flavobacteriales bacterium]MBT6013309.1 RluA family pseudouridine synthase [Flavobacteriales bacterium]MBT7481262.1 RluA family pseudouridine synthase [Flavobacteriales bacterium]